MNTPTRLNDEKARGFEQDEHGEWWHEFSDGRRVRGKYVPCKCCRREFITWRQESRYCSLECEKSRYQRAVPETRACAWCKRDFLGRPNQRFCSHSCAAAKMHARGARTTTKRQHAETLINGTNPRYSQDDSGQWWYTSAGRSSAGRRTRAFVATCERCKKKFLTNINHRKAQRFCTRQCGGKGRRREGLKGIAASNWQGGRLVERGYVLLWSPDHPSCEKKAKPYVFEHRLVMEKVLGRYLKDNEHVHHRDGQRSNNSESNLELWTTSHPYGQRVEDKVKWAREILKLYGDLYPDSA